jgi:hypothetical protein|eukprot:scaffold7259_cov267-Chaetoceros_neogracile.AAC.14
MVASGDSKIDAAAIRATAIKVLVSKRDESTIFDHEAELRVPTLYPCGKKPALLFEARYDEKQSNQ